MRAAKHAVPRTQIVSAPGSGTIDFVALKPLVKPEHIKVFEFGPGLTTGEARSGVEHVKKIWGAE